MVRVLSAAYVAKAPQHRCDCANKFLSVLSRWVATQAGVHSLFYPQSASGLNTACRRLPSMAGENAYNEKDYDAKMQEL